MFSGFGLAGYRSFHGRVQYVGPLTKVTVLAGPNNSGKSNTLRFVQQVLTTLRSANQNQVPGLPSISGFDIPVSHKGQSRLEVAIAAGEEATLNELAARYPENSNIRRCLEQIVSAKKLRPDVTPDQLWIRLGGDRTSRQQGE